MCCKSKWNRKLACRTKINQNDLIEPLSNINIIKDLVVDVSHETFLLDKVKSYIDINSNKEINQEDIEKLIYKVIVFCVILVIVHVQFIV